MRPAGSHAIASSLTLLHTVDGHPSLQCGGVSLSLLYLLLLACSTHTARTALRGLAGLGNSASA